MSKNQNKTQVTQASAADFLAGVVPERKRHDAIELDRRFQKVTGFQPRMWGEAIIGYGQYHYRYQTGGEGDFLATGFSPRKASISIYIMPGYADFADILARLGKHKTGKSCLYVNRLTDIDLSVLDELIVAGLRDLNRHWPVTGPSGRGEPLDKPCGSWETPTNRRP